jgi:transcriptional regulator with XRE-family HTH domain
MNTITLLEFVLLSIRTSDLTQREIAAASGVPYGTVTKIAQGNIKNPGVKHVESLARFFGWAGFDAKDLVESTQSPVVNPLSPPQHPAGSLPSPKW